MFWILTALDLDGLMEPLIKEKAWDKSFEKEIYEYWKETNAYSFDATKKGGVFSIDTPPPYVNAPVHIGQAVTYVLMDMFARFHRMIGDNVLFPLGLDRNGLPIEVAAERKFKVKLNQVSREKFIDMCKSVLEECSIESIMTFLRLGVSFNSWEVGNNIGDAYLTDSSEYRALTQGTFIDLWNKGLIYEAEYPTNFCPGCQVTLADAEVEYEERSTLFSDIVFRVKETGEEIVIATTRPELLCACGMVVFNPEDERYQHLQGKHAIVPLYEKAVPIVAHPIADPQKGTGLVMMCSFGDSADVRFFREMNLTPTFAINADGTMNEKAGPLKGLKVAEARDKILQLLSEKGLVRKQRYIMHNTPICERSKDPIEFISMPEFYLKQVAFKQKMLELAEELEFFAPESRRLLMDWISSISIDWPISKRRFYATEVPLWYCEKCGTTYVPPKGRYYQPWREPPPIDKCPKCGHSKFKGETRVFDTWFDSSISPLYILGYERHNSFFINNSSCTLRPQGKEIIRTWLYYTLLKCYLLTGQTIFRDVWINYHIVDEEGRKMSKSMGNIIDPQDVIDKVGAEPLRLWTALEGNLTQQDFRCSFERIAAAGKTLVKLWNIARFVSMFPQIDPHKEQIALTDLDKWILNEINSITEFARKRYESYDFHNPTVAIRNFIWEAFASHYLELVKNRAYNTSKEFAKEEQNAALYTLHYCLRRILELLAPVIPFITYKLYKDIYGADVHKLHFPVTEEYTSPFTTEEIQTLNGRVWKAKKDKGLSLKDEVAEVVLPEKFKSIEKDLQLAHKIKIIAYEKDITEAKIKL
jgi:valyl-tRNA synthetase